MNYIKKQFMSLIIDHHIKAIIEAHSRMIAQPEFISEQCVKDELTIAVEKYIAAIKKVYARHIR